MTVSRRRRHAYMARRFTEADGVGAALVEQGAAAAIRAGRRAPW